MDTLPGPQQQHGSAWGTSQRGLSIPRLTHTAGRMLGLGHMFGYLAGTVNLTKYTGNWLGDSQFKQVCVLASLVIVSCTAVTCFCVREGVNILKV